jgi:tetratricopeptide (TPR) repeat protein
MKKIKLTFCVLFLIVFNIFAAENYYYRKGIEYASEGKLSEAETALSAAIKENSSDETSRGVLNVIKDLKGGKISNDCASSIFKGLQLLQTGLIEAAIKELKKAVEFNPQYPRPYNILGVIFASQGNTQNAIEYLQRAITIDNQYKEAYFNLASVYQSSGKNEEAIDTYKKYLTFVPLGADACMNIGLLYAAEGKYKESLAYYEKVLATEPSNADAYFNLGLTYFMSDEYTLSKANLLKAKHFYQQQRNANGIEAVSKYLDRFNAVEEKASKALLQKK